MLSDTDIPHSPRVGAAAKTWPGAVAVFGSASDSNYVFNTLIETSSVMGVTETELVAHPAGLRDGYAPLRVRLIGGALASVSWAEVLNGANLAAIGDGSVANWEVFQFETAVLVGDNTYELSARLRGQLGTDAMMPDIWPAGSEFVLLNGAQPQIALGLHRRGVRHLRVAAQRRAQDAQAEEGIALGAGAAADRPSQKYHRPR